MRPYEAALVIQPQLEDEAVTALVDQVEALLTGNGATIDTRGQLIDKRGTVAEVSEGWKKRRLAYAIKHHREGYYAILRFHAPAPALAALDQSLKLNEDVLRFLVLRTEA